jgi:hypothetical protein
MIPYPLTPKQRKKRPVTILISNMVLCGSKNWTTIPVTFVIREHVVFGSNKHVLKLGMVVMQ